MSPRDILTSKRSFALISDDLVQALSVHTLHPIMTENYVLNVKNSTE